MINESLTVIVANLVDARWQKFAVLLGRKASSIPQYKEKSDENFVRAMMVIEDWVAERGRDATAKALIQACENCGIHRDNIADSCKKNWKS